jgi:glyoxylase-like metal-dependent hydrolase (beta-lactamase superfamily II)
MIIERIVVGTLMENAYLAADQESKIGMVIDPGDEPEKIAARVNELQLTVDTLVCTHGHVDHVGAVESLKTQLGARFYLHRADEIYLPHTAEQARLYGMSESENPRVDTYIKNGDRLPLGAQALEVIETPGHSPGSVILVGGGHAFVGDLIFSGSIGRTDLPGGDYEAMMASLELVLRRLPEETKIYPGHGEPTTLAVERRYNPFLQGLRKS